MRRTLPVLALLAFALAAPSAAAQQPPPLAATLDACKTSPLPAERIAIFAGSMPAIARAESMRMRFELERKRPDEELWRRMKGVPGLGVWERSLPNRAGFVFDKRIDSLQVPAAYRVLVRFRWENAGGEVVRSVDRRSAVCQQPDLRPDLVPEELTAVVQAPGLAVYTIRVLNAGRAAATAFTVRIGDKSVEIARLAPGQRRSVLVLAPSCAAGTLVSARVDADKRVEEADERANVLRRACPVAAP